MNTTYARIFRILEEASQDRFDTIAQLYQEHRQKWWYNSDILSRIACPYPSLNGFFNMLTITRDEYLFLMQKLIEHNHLDYLKLKYTGLENIFYNYHTICVYMMSLKLGAESILKWIDMPKRVDNEKKEVSEYDSSYRIGEYLLNEKDCDLLTQFIEYAKPYYRLYYRIGILILIERNESNLGKNLDYKNKIVVKYLDDIVDDLIRDEESFTKIHKTLSNTICIFNIHELYRKERELRKASSIIVELVLENKILKDIVKYTICPYLRLL
jgi:hypothetical protein